MSTEETVATVVLDVLLDNGHGGVGMCDPHLPLDVVSERVAAAITAALGDEAKVAADALSGADLIAAERQRQIAVEGYTAAHDAEHGASMLLRAADCYLHKVPDLEPRAPGTWPWAPDDWKPSTRERNLVKAGALIAAAIDALAATTPTGGDA